MQKGLNCISVFVLHNPPHSGRYDSSSYGNVLLGSQNVNGRGCTELRFERRWQLSHGSKNWKGKWICTVHECTWYIRHVRECLPPVAVQLQGIQTRADLQCFILQVPLQNSTSSFRGQNVALQWFWATSKARLQHTWMFSTWELVWHSSIGSMVQASVSKYCIPTLGISMSEGTGPSQVQMFSSRTLLADLTGIHPLATGWTLRTATSAKLRLTHEAQSLARPGPGSFLSSRWHQFPILVHSLVLDACIVVPASNPGLMHYDAYWLLCYFCGWSCSSVPLLQGLLWRVLVLTVTEI